MRRLAERKKSEAKADCHFSEWHQLSPGTRRAQWVELVEWVIWLHDRYELSRDSKLPDCWPQHPGLVEELWSLKAWREEIYNAAQPSAQAARYWHAELRQVVAAARSSYAPACRAGHKSTPRTVAGEPTLRAAWLSGDPLEGVPPQLLSGGAGGLSDHEVLPDPVIRDGLERRTAYPLGQLIPDFVHFEGAWWGLDHEVSLWRKADPLLAQDLDRKHEAMAALDKLATGLQRINDEL
jgi:hypothetical protein